MLPWSDWGQNKHGGSDVDSILEHEVGKMQSKNKEGLWVQMISSCSRVLTSVLLVWGRKIWYTPVLLKLVLSSLPISLQNDFPHRSLPGCLCLTGFPDPGSAGPFLSSWHLYHIALCFLLGSNWQCNKSFVYFFLSPSIRGKLFGGPLYLSAFRPVPGSQKGRNTYLYTDSLMKVWMAWFCVSSKYWVASFLISH